jgi:hypothetical protein
LLFPSAIQTYCSKEEDAYEEFFSEEF